MMPAYRLPLVAVLAAALTGPAAAGPLDGKRYIIELTHSQHSSGYGEFLVGPLDRALRRAGLRPANGPGADVVVNAVPTSDTGRWTGTGAARAWTYRIQITVGISPEDYVLPPDGTPLFGVRATLDTPNPDRPDELACLVTLAARTAVANWRPRGLLRTDGQSCLRR
jgi:hypothetical protein